jgi:hypothetical protein
MDSERLADLKDGFAERFPYAKLTITRRNINGKTRYYFKTKGAYKVESGHFIELYFETAYRYKEDLSTLTYHYKTD